MRLTPLPLLIPLAALAMGAALFAAPDLSAQTPTDSSQPTGISVVGEGAVLVEPTQARLTFGVEVSDRALAMALREAASRMDAVVNKLIELGVERRDIRTSRFSVQPEYTPQRPLSLVGYRVSNSVSARLRDLGAVGSTIDAVVEAGAVRVHGIAFEVADPAQLKDQARERAMANARAKAEQLARLGGVHLGRPIRIEESDVGGVAPVPMPATARADLAVETPILPGEQEVRALVRVVYAIQ